MKTIIFSVALFVFLLFQAAAQQADYSQLRAAAETEYSQKSYARAHEIYSRVDKSKLSAAELRWVEFRIADTLWRAQAATQTADDTKFEQAKKQLEELIRVADKDVDRDLVWAEAHESLADFFWARGGSMDWNSAWPHYQKSLDWWAGQREIDRARGRYLAIVFKAASPAVSDTSYYYSYYGNYIPIEVLQNALKISTSADERSHLNFLIAMTLRHRIPGGDLEAIERVVDHFEEALKAGKQSSWYDDALFHYAQWMNTSGAPTEAAEGQWQYRADHVKALELYRRLTSEFTAGQTRYFEQATREIIDITTPQLSIAVSNVFLPDSEIQFGLNARNVKRVNFALYKIDMTRDIAYGATADQAEGEGESGNWINNRSTGGREPVRRWTSNLNTSDYRPYSEQSRIAEKVPVGAYLLEAKGDNSTTARDLLLVSDATLVLKSSGKQALVFFSNALSGAPIANANVTLWESYYDNVWRWRRLRQTTNADGLAQFSLQTIGGSGHVFATAASNDRQAFAAGQNSRARQENGWRVYAFTDRPAYRPKETLQWKFIARQSNDGAYSTPANQVIEYQINDQRGQKAMEGKATLNAFGSAWGSIELGEQLPLGYYEIQFWTEGRGSHIGSAMLFRLEEYKLPEFKVEVKTPEQDGRKKAFRLGENVEVDIQADYYFGGPVSNASVEVVVYQKPFYHRWFPHRDYPWYYDDAERMRGYYGGGAGQVVKRETLKTDATGKARLTFETPHPNYNQDYEYRIEARVVDASRREIISADTVRVTRQRYYVYPRPQRNIYRPQDNVTVDIKAIDANEQPVQTEGTVKVTRDYWWEIWTDPSGREVQGEELRRLRAAAVFPPRTTQGEWKLKFRGYQHEDILTTTVKTDAEGVGQLKFTPTRDGYYRVAWQSRQGVDLRRDRFLPPIKTETYVFVATNATTELGYRKGGLEIVVDKDTVRAGQTAPVMISVPATDRYVLFSVEGDDLYSYQLVHVTGTAKLIELPIEEKYIPNVFFSSVTVADAAWFVDTKAVVVPPVEQFLNVAVKADREQYQPREEGTLSISAKDVNGRPVSAEIALGLVDESVKYIEQDYAGDPRQFYYGRKRWNNVQTSSTLNQKSYARLVEVDGALRDGREFVGKEKEQFANRDDDAISMAVYRSDGRPAKSEVRMLAGDGSVNAARSTMPSEPAALMSDRTMAEQAAPPAPQNAPDQAVQVRNDFRSTIVWLPDVRTDADGAATVKVKYPDSLTTWSATARAATTGNQFGIGSASTRTKQPLIVRLQAPRFFVVGDTVTISAVIN
ncbi:MAG TPA: MG2 domain-containing protein, partial [Pyrinomonadaceae bacterium]|nr:MG2 domain-containing protein [Pyrinomonadaceae bacterium]